MLGGDYIIKFNIDDVPLYKGDGWGDSDAIVKDTSATVKHSNAKIKISNAIIKNSNAKITDVDDEGELIWIYPPKGFLSIESTPSDADVYINGTYEGTTPLTIDLTPGTYNITIKKDGYKEYSTTTSISPGESKTINANLSPSYNTGNNNIIVGLILIILLIIGVITIKKGISSLNRNKENLENNQVNTPKTEDIKPETTSIPDFPRELLKKYIPLKKLGEGGFGKVFKVKKIGGTLPLAIKVPNLRENAKKYLLKEIKVWKNLNHPNIVKFYDAFTEPIPHIEMEYIEGYKLNGKNIRDLEDYPKPTSPKVAIKLIKQIAEGLRHAHNKNIIHRDIKPSNILLTEDLTPKITDWGLAKIGAKSSTSTTSKGFTPIYSAPEQIDEEEYGKTDKRTDIYQLGVLFYELLTGRLPYDGISVTQVSLKIVNPNKKPIPPSKINPELSIFDGIFEKLLAKKKEDRYQSIEEFLESLKSIEDIINEKKKLKDTLTKTTQRLKTSTDRKEIERLTKELVDASVKLALNCARINDKVGLLDTLELLREYVKSEENKKELERAISYIEYLIKEGIPIGENTIERLKILLNRIRRERR
ncbi:MAG TPA: PEGA domain-containing protein [Methanothermococcus okinawensis]|nr:PEGA domain-containing protein [Methanothermococcus okinawensis]